MIFLNFNVIIMKNFFLAFTASLLLLTAYVTAQIPNQDKLLMIYEITRHGARGGLNFDYFNETSPTWRPGELTSMGKRQHHMIGGEIRRRYMIQNQLLDLS
jgi:hypothetical protein